MKELLEGKRVCIVGPSKTLIGRGIGNFIDGHDTVVRMNKSIPLNKELAVDIGSRTDLLYHCLDEPNKSKVNVTAYLEEGIKGVIGSYPPLSYTVQNIKYFKTMNKGRLQFRTTKLEVFKQLEKDLDTRPNTGLMALTDVLQYDIKELYLTGFCFYRNFYYDGYTDLQESQYSKVAESPTHDQNKQMKYWAKLYKEDNRIIIDKVLEELFKEEGLI